ncbi:Transcription factor [Acorus gramineus]|uniref:Transcription factor n=1 Tax=Acorus gramineus TaxID=55184 RepID=A0AAV9A9W3_ACOGR|nr:Transcription factor [Acorus gramineus]
MERRPTEKQTSGTVDLQCVQSIDGPATSTPALLGPGGLTWWDFDCLKVVPKTEPFLAAAVDPELPDLLLMERTNDDLSSIVRSAVGLKRESLSLPAVTVETKGKTKSRERRSRIRERTRQLERLMPWEDKKFMGNTLAEAYKYVRFLQSQLTVLRAMPCKSAVSVPPSRTGDQPSLESLTRQQLLQVLVNSPRVQNKLSLMGYCVYSVEQVSLLREILKRRELVLMDGCHSSVNQ